MDDGHDDVWDCSLFMAAIRGSRTNTVAEAPAGHCVRLGNAVDQQDAVLERRGGGDQAGHAAVAKVDFVVDLVREDEDVRVFLEDRAECLQFLAGVHGTGRVGRGVEDEPLGLGGDGLCQGGRSELEACVLPAGDDHRGAVVGKHHVRVGNPVRRRDNHFVAFIERRHEGYVQDLLGPAADGQLVPLIVVTGVALDLPQDGGLQLGSTCHGGVLGLSVVDRLDGGCLDVVRGIEVRLADRQVDDRDAFGFEFADTGGCGDAR